MLAEGVDGAIWPGISTIVNIGFSGVVAWYLLTKALPKMQEAFLADIEKISQRYDAREEEGKKESERREGDRRSEAREAIKVVIEHCDKESMRHDDVLKVNLNLVTQAVSDQREVLEEVRDVLRDFRSEKKDKIKVQP